MKFTKKKTQIDQTETGDFYGHAALLVTDPAFQATMLALNARCDSAEVEITVFPIDVNSPLDEEAITEAIIFHGSKEQCAARERVNAAKEFNKPIKAEIEALDKKRIRPLAEGDVEYLEGLNKQIVVLREALIKEE